MLEITVAIGIIVVGLLGVVSLVVQNLQVQNMNKNYLIASMLAQEGLELVRNKRDTNWLLGATGDEWKYGRNYVNNLDIVQNGNYTVDLDGVINNAADSISDPEAKLYIDGYGFYFHPGLPTTATTTPFFRIINITEHASDENILGASSTVLWQERGRTHKYVAETWLYNWR